jgi:branched-chain amino acid transport system permease protein
VRVDGFSCGEPCIKEAPLELFINQVFSGLVRSALYFLVTSGLTLLFGVVGTLNMAHFSLYMIASYLTWTFHTMLRGFEFSFWLAFVLAAFVMCILGWIIERLVMRHIYGRELGEQLLITFAMVYILDDLTKIVWGSNPLFVARPEILTRIISWGGVSLPASDIFVLLLGVISGLGTWYLLARTRTGRILRASYSHKEMLPALGIPIHRIYMGIFVLSVLLASIAGSAWTLMGMVDLGQAHTLLIEAFCVMVIGGMGSFAGTAVSAVICGLTYSFAILYVPKIATLLIFVLAGIVLIFRPWGLMGTAGRLH